MSDWDESDAVPTLDQKFAHGWDPRFLPEDPTHVRQNKNFNENCERSGNFEYKAGSDRNVGYSGRKPRNDEDEWGQGYSQDDAPEHEPTRDRNYKRFNEYKAGSDRNVGYSGRKPRNDEDEWGQGYSQHDAPEHEPTRDRNYQRFNEYKAGSDRNVGYSGRKPRNDEHEWGQGYSQHDAPKHEPTRDYKRFNERSGGDGFKPRGDRKPHNNFDEIDNFYDGRGGRGGRKPYKPRNDLENGGGFGEAQTGEEEEKPPRMDYVPPEPSLEEGDIFGTGIETGINFSKYKDIPIKISGENLPQSVDKFDKMGLRDLLLSNIKKSKYKEPTPIQKAGIPTIMAGRDLMGCAQTGSGKTAAFLLPIINLIMEENPPKEVGKPIAMIITPTRELAIQIHDEARKFAHGSVVSTLLVYGGTQVRWQRDKLSQGCHILIGTPGRIFDFLSNGRICFDKLKFIVLDEADRMLDMGFKTQIEQLLNHSTIVKEDLQLIMFSATFPDEIQRLAAQYLRNYIFIAVGVVGGACSDVKQTILEISSKRKRAKLVELLEESADGTIVFVSTKKNADFLAVYLSRTEFPTTSIHGDRMQSQREEALRDFRTGRMKVLIATAVAARGLDIRAAKHVINYDLPTEIDEYVHRIGRTGRVGNLGRATSFFDPAKDRALAKGLIDILTGADQKVPEFLKAVASCDVGGTGYSGFDDGFGGIDIRASNNNHIEEDETWG